MEHGLCKEIQKCTNPTKGGETNETIFLSLERNQVYHSCPIIVRLCHFPLQS